MEIEQRCLDLVEELSLAQKDDVRKVVPLTGGVASDIAMVDLGHRRICVKFALPKLKVAADWRAPVHRNAAEYAWLQVAAKVSPESAVNLFGRSETAHGFAMDFLEGEGVYLWKANLLNETLGKDEASEVADLLGRIHAISAKSSFDRSPFQNRDDFHALRIEPYLTQTRKAHPELAGPIMALEKMLYESNAVLVHGDASPKNILFRNQKPILLDAECATMGDASFDPSFCINHLFLKAIHLPNSRNRLLEQAMAFWAAYSSRVDWEDRKALENRVCALLPVLMLARVDGKSPVEYLSEPAKDVVREIAIPLIRTPAVEFSQLTDQISTYLNGDTN